MLLTTGQAAGELGCAVTTFRRLVHAEVLPDLSSRGNRVMVPWDAVQQLRDRPAAPLHRLKVREVAVLRVNVAQPVQEPARQWIGFSAALGPDDLLKALQGWWRCDPESVAAGGVLPVTLSGYVVAVLTQVQTWERNRGRYRFPDAVLAGYVTDLVGPVTHLTDGGSGDRAAAELLLGTRLVSHSGGAIAYVPAGSSAAG
ncbi:DNA-binding protein [Streptomyces sp. NPDC048111]|uniref:DNA-binding protein n=1 Tax=Streptomyces sp. NPDC048111 TaxID=3365500 RepID=UPI0037193B4C